MSTLLETASGAVAKGLSVVAMAGKQPMVLWGPFVERLLTQDDLTETFARAVVTWFAVVLGPATWARRAYLWVLDIDRKYRADAEGFLDRHLLAWHDGLLAESGGGGLHLCLLAFSPPATRRFGWGDVEGGSFIVVLPRSLHGSGRRYRRLSRGEPLACDPDAFTLPGLERRPLYEDLGSGPVHEGDRNKTLASLAGLLRHVGLDAATIAAALQDVNRRRCVPSLPEEDVAKIARV